MNKIEEFTILGKLEELDKEKFNSSEFQKVNKLQELLVEISTNKKNYSQIISF